MKNIYIRLLQFLIGTEVDGDFGVKSEAAANALIKHLERYQEAFAAVTRKQVDNVNDNTLQSGQKD